MYKGKRVKKITHVSKRAALLVLSLVTILTISVSGTLAYLIRRTNEVQNNFIPGTIDTETKESFTGDEKTDVYVTNSGENTGSLPVYVRAKVVFAWTKEMEAEGGKKQVVLPDPVVLEPKEGANVDITWGSTGKWRPGNDGFYYYSEVLMPGAKTDLLIKSCSPNNLSPVGAKLQVTIMTQSIQAYQSKEADDQIKAAWGTEADRLLPDPYTGPLPATTGAPAGGTT